MERNHPRWGQRLLVKTRSLIHQCPAPDPARETVAFVWCLRKTKLLFHWLTSDEENAARKLAETLPEIPAWMNSSSAAAEKWADVKQQVAHLLQVGSDELDNGARDTFDLQLTIWELEEQVSKLSAENC